MIIYMLDLGSKSLAPWKVRIGVEMLSSAGCGNVLVCGVRVRLFAPFLNLPL